MPVNVDGRNAIDELVNWHRDRYGEIDAKRPLFPSRNGKGQQQMSRRTAHNVLKDAFVSAGLNGHIATHSLRKSFAQRLYEATGDIFAVQEMLGHRNVSTTQKYLGVNYRSIKEAVEKMAITYQPHTTSLWSSSQKTKDETTAEIMKIG